MKVGEKTLVGRTVEIHADKSGRWRITEPDEGQTLGSSYGMLDTAIELAKKKLQAGRVKVEVRFRTLDGKQGVATGRHAGNNAILARVGTRAEQFKGYRATIVLKPDVPDEVLVELRDARQAISDAEQTQREAEQRYGLDLGQAVDDAIAAAMEAA